MTPNIYKDPVLLTQELIKIDTRGGNEKAAIDLIEEGLNQAGIKTERIFLDEKRPNILAKLYGAEKQFKLPPLLLYGHLDTVPTDGQVWEKDPLSGTIEDGYLWGRGAVDMKTHNGIFVSTMIRLKEENVQLPFDVYYLGVSDEEGDSEYGMKYLVENHSEIFQGIKYAIGEVGGFSMEMFGKKIYPIQVSEKQVAQIRITAKGLGGHGSMIHQNTAMERLTLAAYKLSRKKLKVRVSDGSKHMIKELSKSLSFYQKCLMNLLLIPTCTNRVLKMMGDKGKPLDAILHNTINITAIGGGNPDAINVIPSTVWCEGDLRVVPNGTIEEAISDIKEVIGEGYQIQVIVFDYGAKTTDFRLYDSMAKVAKDMDPKGTPIPYVLGAVTDGRFLSRVGIQSYGFVLMDLPKDYVFLDMLHKENERIPVEAISYGTSGLYTFITQFYSSNF